MTNSLSLSKKNGSTTLLEKCYSAANLTISSEIRKIHATITEQITELRFNPSLATAGSPTSSQQEENKLEKLA